MKNSLPGALVLGFVSLAWGEESLRAQPVRSHTELPPAAEPPPPQSADAPWSFAALHAKKSPQREADSESAQTYLAANLSELDQLQNEIARLRQRLDQDAGSDQER